MRANGTRSTYQAIGSGGGISEFTQGVVNFGARRAHDEHGAGGRPGRGGSVALHIPMIIGANSGHLQEPTSRTSTPTGPRWPASTSDHQEVDEPAIKKLNPV